MDVSQLINSIDAAIGSLTQGGVTADTDRQQLLAAANRLRAASESPLDSVISIVLGVRVPTRALSTSFHMADKIDTGSFIGKPGSAPPLRWGSLMCWWA